MRAKHAPGPLLLQLGSEKRAMSKSKLALASALALTLTLIAPLGARAEPPGDPIAVTEDSGKWRDKNGDPTYKVSADGTVDWYTYSGFRRYHSECHVCHGPDGEGSSYAPALANALKTIAYAEFYGIVVSGKKDLGAG